MKKSYLVALGLAVSAILPFVGCDKNKEVVIGGVAPLTGEAATFGVSTKNGYDLAVAEWNAKGGVLGKQVKLVFADDKGDPAEGATVYTKLIEQDKACAIVGTVMSKVSLAGAPICQAAKIPMIATASTNPKVTGVGNFVFRACFIDPFQGTVGAKFAFDDLKAKKAACLFDVGNDYTKGLSEFFKTKFTALGGEIVGFEGHATGTSDFKAQLTKVLAAKPDVLYVSDYYSDVAIIANEYPLRFIPEKNTNLVQRSFGVWVADGKLHPPQTNLIDQIIFSSNLVARWAWHLAGDEVTEVEHELLFLPGHWLNAILAEVTHAHHAAQQRGRDAIEVERRKLLSEMLVGLEV